MYKKKKRLPHHDISGTIRSIDLKFVEIRKNWVLRKSTWGGGYESVKVYTLKSLKDWSEFDVGEEGDYIRHVQRFPTDFSPPSLGFRDGSDQPLYPRVTSTRGSSRVPHGIRGCRGLR
ncbi:hypothetical protein TNCV_981591 [Trichonephila clavipes]|nr:hypothetical protein TNCV_981591 [Trichonephila clavipes]